ncbi:MAG: hypothetical protein DRN49_00395 [Thaumarchaeota archaeon]|nr:MAG: hypothetical protein DRN49_00395 [Nitrososphaerota archaeon]
MRLILINFENVLGLNGYLNFVEGKPLMIYGENVSGKSNIINMIRYCLIPRSRERKGYREEKRLKKNEILLKRNSAGSVEIYFEQNRKFYKLYYYFSRRGKNVSQTQRLFESKQVELPLEDEERIKVLTNLDWKDTKISSMKSLREKLVEMKIYPEVLDILISPSNVRNFSEAINGSVIKVPEIIQARISKIHENVRKYLDNLKKLYGVIVLEREELETKTRELRKSFEEVIKNLPEIKVDKIFVGGETARNLENLQNFLVEKLKSIPSKVSEMKETLGLLSSEKYEIWTGAIDKLVMILPRKEELKDLMERRDSIEKLEETLKTWKIIFEGLPPDSHPEGLLTFSMPNFKKSDFNALSNPERVKSIFLAVDEAKKSLQRANETCKKYKVPLTTSDINRLIKSYSELLKALKAPLEPKGDPALLSKLKEKVVVSIPLDIALEKMEYLRGVEPTPLIHRPESFGKEEFMKRVSRLKTEVKDIQGELRKTKSDMSKAKKLLKKAKRLRGDIDRELKVLDRNMKNLKRELDKLIKEASNAYHHLCEVFKLKREEIDLSSKYVIDSSFETISAKCKEAQKIFLNDLIQQMKNYPEILEKYKISEERDFTIIIKRIREEFEKRIKEVSRLEEEYKNVNDWILRNTAQLKAIENRSKTIIIVDAALLIAQAILSRIFEKTDINKIIEDLSENLEKSVKDVYKRIFPEDESFSFSHSGRGQFISTINNEPITHPSGSQRAAISVGIMLSLARTFGLPMILDEAFDRIDVKRLKFFCECITGLTDCQTCLAAYTSFNIEKNPEVLPFINSWKTYLVERAEVLEKNIKPLEGLQMGK